MKPLQIPRHYLTMREIVQRWKLETPLDLRRVVMDGTLKVCLMMQEELQPVVIVGGKVEPSGDAPTPVRGWLYPQFPSQVLPFDCLYSVVSDMAVPVEGCSLWALPRSLTLGELMADGVGVSMLEDVEEAERALTRDPDRPLTGKQERTRDRLLTAFAVEHLGWEPWRDESELTLSAFLRGAEAWGCGVSRAAAKENLRLAWERTKPNLAESPLPPAG